MKPRAGQISVNPSGLAVITTDDVQAALEELDAAVDSVSGGSYTDPLTTKGDLVGRSSTTTSRLAVGTDGQVLTADSTQTLGVKWATPSAGSGGSGDVDDPATWGTDLGYDYEFTGSGSTVPSGWAWVNQGGATYTEAYGAGLIHAPNQVGDQVRAIVQAVPGTSSWTLTAKLGVAATPLNYAGCGLILRDSSSGKLVLLVNNGAGTLNNQKWNSVTSYNSEITTKSTNQRGQSYYVRVRKNSATSYDFGLSQDGVAWAYTVSGFDLSAWMTLSHFGWFANVNNAGNTDPAQTACHWFRVR